jgi:glycosyltransferase involved in cell wall biosynthesis
MTWLFALPWDLQHAGGVNQVVRSLAHQMAASGRVKPLVLIMDWHSPTPVWEVVDGIQTVRWRVRNCPGYEDRPTLRERLSYWVWECWFRPRFRQLCRQHHVAAINPHYPGAGAITLQRAAEPGLPMIMSFHGTDARTLAAAAPPVRAPWAPALARAHAVVPCSLQLQSVVASVSAPATRLHTIHNGIDIAAFMALGRDDAPAAGARRTIVCVGRFVQSKGHDTLLQAYARLAGDYPDVDLLLIGASDSALPALRAACAAQRLEQRVTFLADIAHEQVARHMRHATVFVLPSRLEGFPLVLLEAAAFRVPVVSTNVGGIPELLQDGVNGYMIEPDDAMALEQRLRALLAAPALAATLGERLHDDVASHFTWEATCRQYLALLDLPQAA